jgi:predicted ATPase
VISALSVGNFKCFKSATIGLGAANVFSGVNGAGKSTILQALLALRQSWEAEDLTSGRIQLSGSLIDLGTSGEVYCAEPVSERIDLVLESSAGPTLAFRCPQAREKSQDYFITADPLPKMEPDGVASFGLFSDPFNYLHAERVGPRKVFEISTGRTSVLSVGKNGGAAPFIVASGLRETAVTNDALVLESSDGKEYRTLRFQWPLWMARLFPGFEEESEIYARADQVRLGVALQRQATGSPLFVRPTNTGFGISFVLGIVVAGLVASPGTTLIVENPEAHLHPRAQSAVGEFLGRVSAGGVQVFVETHSEHVVNGMRRMVKQTILRPEDLRILFFGRDENQSEPTITPVSVSQDGQMDPWPDGFFDQLDVDLGTLLDH